MRGIGTRLDRLESTIAPKGFGRFLVYAAAEETPLSEIERLLEAANGPITESDIVVRWATLPPGSTPEISMPLVSSTRHEDALQHLA